MFWDTGTKFKRSNIDNITVISFFFLSEVITDPDLGHEETTMFRAVAARLNCLSQDRPDITFATMKLCSKMSRPDAQDLNNMWRVGRFLVGRPRVGCLFEWQAHPSALHALADAVWAGGGQSRKSVSGGMILHGKHLLKALTKQQSIVATSTAEAELYAGDRAATESMGVQAFAKDLGRVVLIQLHIDSSAALSIISRTGLGKAEHIEIQYLCAPGGGPQQQADGGEDPVRKQTRLTWAQSISQAKCRRC